MLHHFKRLCCALIMAPWITCYAIQAWSTIPVSYSIQISHMLSIQESFVLFKVDICLPRYVKLLIQGNSSSELTTIDCKGLRGFGFERLRVKIENIVIKNCGGAISSDAVRSINDSTFYFGPGQGAVFLFVNCLSVDIRAVTITNYTGYSIIGIFDGSTSLSMTSVHTENSAYYSLLSQDKIDLPPPCNNQSYSCSGSGVFLYYGHRDYLSSGMISL